MQENDLEESRRMWNSLESSGRFSRFLEVFGRMLLEGSERNGFSIYRSGRYSPYFIDRSL